MGNNAETAATKKTWFIIFGALTYSVLIYGLLCFLMLKSRTTTPAGNMPGTMRPILYGLGALALIASVAWLHWRTAGKIGDAPAIGTTTPDVMPPPKFQTETIVAMALAEVCVLLGLMLFFLGAPIREFAVFGAGTLLVDLLFVLPRGLKYWAAWETQQKAQSSTRAFSQLL